jgi:phi13 family phage major tail protein
MANEGEYKSKVGLDSLYVAAVTADSASAYTAGSPTYLAPAAEASLEPTTSFEIQYADDQPYDVMTAEGDTKVKLVITGIDMATLAAITGRIYDAATGRMYDNGGSAPYYALGFRSLKSNGSYRYFWFLKGKFDMPKEEIATKGEKPEPKTLELTFTAIRTTYKWTIGSVTDSHKRVMGDSDATGFSGTTWFSQVQVYGATSPSALALSSSTPADAATGVSVSANQTLTFNNALAANFQTEGVGIYTLTTMAAVAATLTIDTDKKVITINPDSNLTGATAYAITYYVKDIYNQTLKGAINFTTT